MTANSYAQLKNGSYSRKLISNNILFIKVILDHYNTFTASVYYCIKLTAA